MITIDDDMAFGVRLALFEQMVHKALGDVAPDAGWSLAQPLVITAAAGGDEAETIPFLLEGSLTSAGTAPVPIQLAAEMRLAAEASKPEIAFHLTDSTAPTSIPIALLATLRQALAHLTCRPPRLAGVALTRFRLIVQSDRLFVLARAVGLMHPRGSCHRRFQ